MKNYEFYSNYVRLLYANIRDNDSKFSVTFRIPFCILFPYSPYYIFYGVRRNHCSILCVVGLNLYGTLRFYHKLFEIYAVIIYTVFKLMAS